MWHLYFPVSFRNAEDDSFKSCIVLFSIKQNPDRNCLFITHWTCGTSDSSTVTATGTVQNQRLHRREFSSLVSQRHVWSQHKEKLNVSLPFESWSLVFNKVLTAENFTSKPAPDCGSIRKWWQLSWQSCDQKSKGPFRQDDVGTALFPGTFYFLCVGAAQEGLVEMTRKALEWKKINSQQFGLKSDNVLCC